MINMCSYGKYRGMKMDVYIVDTPITSFDMSTIQPSNTVIVTPYILKLPFVPLDYCYIAKVTDRDIPTCVDSILWTPKTWHPLAPQKKYFYEFIQGDYEECKPIIMATNRPLIWGGLIYD